MPGIPEPILDSNIRPVLLQEGMSPSFVKTLVSKRDFFHNLIVFESLSVLK
jgi:hypothetical protein